MPLAAAFALWQNNHLRAEVSFNSPSLRRRIGDMEQPRGLFTVLRGKLRTRHMS